MNADLYGLRINSPDGYNASAAALTSVIGGAVGTVQLGTSILLAANGDQASIELLAGILKGVGEFIAHPIDTTEQTIQQKLNLAKQLEAQGRVDEAQRIRYGLVADGALIVTSTGTVVANTGRSLLSFGKKVDDVNVSNPGKNISPAISPENQKYVDILSLEAKQHILYGDKPGSGGHLYLGQSGKTTFPQNWSADKVVHEIGDITTSPNTQWYAQTGTGDIYTSKGKPANWVAYEVRDEIRIRVVYQPATGKVITAFPDMKPTPSSYKPIK